MQPLLMKALGVLEFGIYYQLIKFGVENYAEKQTLGT